MNELVIRVAQENDADGFLKLVAEFAQGHPSKDHPRSKKSYIEAYFRDNPSAEIIIAGCLYAKLKVNRAASFSLL